MESTFHHQNLESHFQDLNPVITYRHLHSRHLANDPLRVVALVDSDAFYAQAERNRLNLGDDIPLVVLQWESLIAVSYPARKFGVSRFDKLTDAKVKCPEVVAVHVATYQEGVATEPGYWDERDSRTHKVSLDYYRRESAKVYAKFKEGACGGEVEKASIDEVFIDLSSPVRDRIIERYPHLKTVPEDAPFGSNTPLPQPLIISWKDNVHGYLLSVDGVDESESGLDKGRDSPPTWHDVALSIGAEIVDDIRARVRDDLRYTTSAGIARNKAMAKLVASYKKPNSQTILRNCAIPAYLCPLSFQKIRNLGGKFGENLAEQFKVATIGELLSVTQEEMQKKLGGDCVWLYDLIRGIDRSEVKERSALNKSMLASKNLQKPITRVDDGPHWIRVLAAELHLRLKESRETFPGLWPKTITLQVRNGYDSHKSKQNSFPFVRELSIDDIVRAGARLWTSLTTSSPPPLRITNLSLSFTGLEFEEGQQSIEGFFAGPSAAMPHSDSDSGHRKRKRGVDSELEEQPLHSPPVTEQALATKIGFHCEPCGRRIEAQLLTEDPSLDESAVLVKLRLEHEDFHIAQDLIRSESKKISFHSQRGPNKPPLSSKPSKSSSRPGIARYFKRSKS